MNKGLLCLGTVTSTAISCVSVRHNLSQKAAKNIQNQKECICKVMYTDMRCANVQQYTFLPLIRNPKISVDYVRF